MGSGIRTPFENPVVEWIDSRLPVFTLMQKEYGVFPTPRNFNYFWNFGAIAMVMLTLMIVTGIVLAMQYTPNSHMAFDSVERIMRDVNSGWLIRYLHMNGASFFFIAVYIHIFRGMYYGSYKKPRELLWILGVLIFLLMMATAFMGYVLPWGQMSYWGATVITNLFSAIPVVGESIKTWLWGGFSVDNPTLNRFFALHYLLPFIIFAVVFLHVWALHVVGSNNPLGIDVKGPQDTVPFHPYYTIKDTFGTLVFLAIFCFFVFFRPDALGHPDNYIPANPMVTPAHIVPEWYFLPFYAMLRAITFGINAYIGLGLLVIAFAISPLYRKNASFDMKRALITAGVGGVLFLLGYVCQLDGSNGHKLITLPLGDLFFVDAKLGGVLTMFGSIALLFILPWLDSHPIRSAKFRPMYQVALLIWLVVFVFLGFVGSQPADATFGDALVKIFSYIPLLGGILSGIIAAILSYLPFIAKLPLVYFGLAATGYYYGFFLVVLAYLNKFEKGRDLPPSIHEAVLKGAA